MTGTQNNTDHGRLCVFLALSAGALFRGFSSMAINESLWSLPPAPSYGAMLTNHTFFERRCRNRPMSITATLRTGRRSLVVVVVVQAKLFCRAQRAKEVSAWMHTTCVSCPTNCRHRIDAQWATNRGRRRQSDRAATSSKAKPNMQERVLLLDTLESSRPLYLLPISSSQVTTS